MDPVTLFRILKSPRLWKVAGIVVLVLALVACLFGIYLAGVHDERERLTAIHSAEIARLAEDAAKALATAQAEARATEQLLVHRIYDIEGKLHDQNQAAEAERERLLAAVRAGELRLRDRFTCPAPAGGVPAVAAGAGISEPAEAGGLQSADVEFLVRLAGEADAVTRQLTACQGILASERKATE